MLIYCFEDFWIFLFEEAKKSKAREVRIFPRYLNNIMSDYNDNEKEEEPLVIRLLHANRNLGRGRRCHPYKKNAAPHTYI